MEAEFKNGARNYLSMGDAQLPTVYLVLSVAFLLATFVWIYALRKHSDHVRRLSCCCVHWLLTLAGCRSSRCTIS